MERREREEHSLARMQGSQNSFYPKQGSSTEKQHSAPEEHYYAPPSNTNFHLEEVDKEVDSYAELENRIRAFEQALKQMMNPFKKAKNVNSTIYIPPYMQPAKFLKTELKTMKLEKKNMKLEKKTMEPAAKLEKRVMKPTAQEKVYFYHKFGPCLELF